MATNVNLCIPTKPIILIAGGAVVAGLIFTLNENRHYRKELEKRTSHNEESIRFLYNKVRELESREVH